MGGSKSSLSSPRFCTVLGIFDTCRGNNGALAWDKSVEVVRKMGFFRQNVDWVKPREGLPVLAV